MHIRTNFLATACVLALAACGDTTPDTTAETPAPAAEPAPAPTQTPAPAPAGTSAPAPLASTPGDNKPAAVITNCATTIESTDTMQYNIGSIAVPASCSEFKITLKHTGTMQVAAMGHNVVITAAADMQAVAADGLGAGADAGYVKPGDARVIAHTGMIGGGETSSLSFPVSKLQGGGPYEFFCSFPGHYALMKGTIAVE